MLCKVKNLRDQKLAIMTNCQVQVLVKWNSAILMFAYQLIFASIIDSFNEMCPFYKYNWQIWWILTVWKIHALKRRSSWSWVFLQLLSIHVWVLYTVSELCIVECFGVELKKLLYYYSFVPFNALIGLNIFSRNRTLLLSCLKTFVRVYSSTLTDLQSWNWKCWVLPILPKVVLTNLA